MSIRIRAAILVACALAATLRAEPTRKVSVALDWPCGAKPVPEIGVVLNGDETHPIIAAYHDDLKRWIGERDRQRGTFDASTATASLRLNGRRTGSVRASAQKIAGEYVAAFTFPCNERPTHIVEIAPIPEKTAVGYRRAVETDQSPVYKETYFDATGIDRPVTVRDVWFPFETLRVQLAWPAFHEQDPGLLLFRNDASGFPLFLPDEKTGAATVNRSLRLPEVQAGNKVTVAKKDLIHLFALQHGAQRIKGDEIDNYEVRLSKVSAVVLTVK